MMKKAISILTVIIWQFVCVYGQLGTIDPNFNPGTGFGGGITQSRVESIIQQPDDKLLVGGWFTDYNGTASNFIARLNLDGSIDNSFNIGSGFTGFSGYVKTIVLQSDGKMIVGGNYTHFNGTIRHRIARLDSDGSLDLSFDPLTGFNSDVNTIAIQTDGKIIVAGVFSAYDWQNLGGISRPRIARLHSGGSLDTSFDPQNGFVSTTGAQARIHKLIIQPDGKILACGQFDEFNGVTRIIIARLNSDGTLDNSFDAGSNFQLNFGFYGEAWDMKLQPDGKILLAGNFGHTGASNSGVIRLNSDGTIDNSFTLNKKATSIGLQPDGKVYVSETGPYNFNRHNSDGTPDISFPQTTFNDIAQTIFIQTDGNILIGGWFSYNPSGIMRLMGDNPTTGVPDLTNVDLDIQVYPNPAIDILRITVKNELFLPDLNLSIVNQVGQSVKKISINATLNELNISDLPKGVYIYSIENPTTLFKSGVLVVN